MPNVKFSDFPADPFANGYLVGLDGSNQNIKVDRNALALSLSQAMNLGSISGNLNLGTQVTGVLPMANGGTNATTPDDALTNVTNATIRPANSILQFDGTGWIIANPTDNPNIPILMSTSYSWEGLNPYYAFTPFLYNTIPYDTQKYGYSNYINPSLYPTINTPSPTDTSFTFSPTSYNCTYKIEIMGYFTNQGQNHFMQTYLLDGSNNVINLITSDHNSGPPIEKTYYGYCYYVPQPGNNTIKVAAFPENPFVTGSSSGNQYNRITITLVQKP